MNDTFCIPSKLKIFNMHRENIVGRCYDGHTYLRYDIILDQFLDNKDGLRTMKINVRIEFPFFFMIDAPTGIC